MRLKSLFLIVFVLFPITVGARVAAQATATPAVILYPTATARPRTATPRVTASPTRRPTATATDTPSPTMTLVVTTSSTNEPAGIRLTESATSAATDAGAPAQASVISVDDGALATQPAIGVPEGRGTEQAATDAVTPDATDGATSGAPDAVTPAAAETLAATGEADRATAAATPAPIAVATEPAAPAGMVRVGVVVYQDTRGDQRCQGNPVVVGEPVEFQVGTQTFQVRTNNDGLALAGEFPPGTAVEARYVGSGLLSGASTVHLESDDKTPCAFGLTSLPAAAKSSPALSVALVLAGVAVVLVVLSVAVIVAFRMSN